MDQARRVLRWRMLWIGILSAASACSVAPTGRPLVVSCGAIGKEFELCKNSAARWAHQNAREVQVVSAPQASGDRLAQYQLMLAAKSPDIDVFLIDTTWPGMLGDFFVDLRGKLGPEVLEDFFPAFLENNSVRGRLIALPWFIDAGILYYRKDLLEAYGEKVPATWEELTRIARRIQKGERAKGNALFWGFVFQGRAYEGLTCNALEWIASHGGGKMVEGPEAVTIANPRARAALSLAATWVGHIAPPGTLNFMEEESRGVFQAGNAAFLRNWPYVWKLAQAPDSPVRGKIGVSALPRGDGGKPAATLGGWSLGVSRYSRQVDASVSLVKELASPNEQKRRALAAGLNPALRSLYSDPDLLRDNPALKELFPLFENAIPRPSQASGTRYNQVSTEIWESVHQILTRQVKVEPATARLQRQLERILGQAESVRKPLFPGDAR